MYRRLIRPILFKSDPEKIHESLKIFIKNIQKYNNLTNLITYPFRPKKDSAENFMDFKNKIETERQFLYRAYESVDQWEGVFREDLCKWLDGQSPTPFRITSVSPSTFPEGLLQKYEERIKHLEGELKKRASEQIEIAYTLAQEAQEKADSGQITKAEEYFAKAVAVSMDPGIINDYGLFLARIGMLAKAEEKFRQVAQLGKAIDEKSIEAVAYGNLGILYLTRGVPAAAASMSQVSAPGPSARNAISSGLTGLGRGGRMARPAG